MQFGIIKHLLNMKRFMPTLSTREKQILKMLLAEYTQKEISETLELSYSRVNDVKTKIMEKWCVTTMVGLVKESIRQGYIDMEDDELVA